MRVAEWCVLGRAGYITASSAANAANPRASSVVPLRSQRRTGGNREPRLPSATRTMAHGESRVVVQVLFGKRRCKPKAEFLKAACDCAFHTADMPRKVSRPKRDQTQPVEAD